MSPKYQLARSLCDAAAWDHKLLESARNGQSVAEIDERRRAIGISNDEIDSLLTLAVDLATAVAERDQLSLRVLSSKPKLVPAAAHVWAIGQEWLELIRHASEQIVLVSPSLDDVAAENLRVALATAAQAGTKFVILHGVLGDRERLRLGLNVLARAFPRAEVLEWPAENGFLHAKLICVDDSTIYLGSANLTDYGWQKNVEVGLTLHGAAAAPLIEYCNGLISIAREANRETKGKSRRV